MLRFDCACSSPYFFEFFNIQVARAVKRVFYRREFQMGKHLRCRCAFTCLARSHDDLNELAGFTQAVDDRFDVVAFEHGGTSFSCQPIIFLNWNF